MRYQEAEERPKLLEELGHRLQYYAAIAGEFRNKDEKYIHIDEMEMMKVEKCVSEVIEWMNNAVSAQAKKSLDQDPAVRSFEIKAKLQELNNVCEPIVTQPKPKVDSPKEENPLNEQGDYKTEDMGEDDKNSDMPQQNGECHPGDQNTVNMDLD